MVFLKKKKRKKKSQLLKEKKKLRTVLIFDQGREGPKPLLGKRGRPNQAGRRCILKILFSRFKSVQCVI